MWTYDEFMQMREDEYSSLMEPEIEYVVCPDCGDPYPDDDESQAEHESRCPGFPWEVAQ